jgi:hypothetical protein
MPGVTPLASLAAPVFAPVIVAVEALARQKPSPKPSRKMAPRADSTVEVTLGNGRVLKADEGIAPERLSALVAALDR